MKRLFSALALLALGTALLPVTDVAVSGCSSDACSESRWGYAYNAFDSYDVHVDHVTRAGTAYDPSGLSISPDLIDRLTNEVEACLMQNGFTKGPIDRHSFVVKVAGDWLLNCDQTQQLLPVLAGSEGCVAKGLVPTEACPCRFRAGIQCPNHLIVTPNFYLYKDVLIRFVIGTMNPWVDEKLATCASPTTTPLSDGSDPNNGLP